MERRDFLKYIQGLALIGCGCTKAHAWIKSEPRAPSAPPSSTGPTSSNRHSVPSRGSSNSSRWDLTKGGCHIVLPALDAQSTEGPALKTSSGIGWLDDAFRVEYNVIATTTGLWPSFAFFEDEQPNAFASPIDIFQSSSHGAVLFGINLIRETRRKAGDTSLVGIMAHEWGHICQFQKGIIGVGGKGPELHADFLAGWYLGCKYRNGKFDLQPQAFAQSLFELGDFNFNDRSHHGMPYERVDAMVRGFNFALYNPIAGIDQAFIAGRNAVGFW